MQVASSCVLQHNQESLILLAGRQPYSKQRKTFWRTNQNIRSAQLRVIDSEGKQLGIFSNDEAQAKAAEMGLDLVEIAPNAKPPVSKIIDFTKFRYQQEKKERESKRKVRRGTEQKEVWLTPFMGDSDYEVRLGRIKEFLDEGSKVRIVVRFKGAQMAHKEFGYGMANKVKTATQDRAGIDQEPKFLGRQLIMVLTPMKKAGNTEIANTIDNGNQQANKLTS